MQQPEPAADAAVPLRLLRAVAAVAQRGSATGAAVDLHQTWLWFASGIVLGLMILALFGMFERKRQEVLQLVDQLKTWEA